MRKLQNIGCTVDENEIRVNLDSVYFEILSICNLKCRHCYNRACETGQYSKQEIFDIIEQIYDLECKKIVLSGGEPFLCEFIFDIIEECSRRNMEVLIVTNGTLLQRSIINKLMRYTNVRLQISLDGTCAEENDFIRGKDNYKKVLEALEILKETDIKVNISYVLMNNTGECLESLIKKLDSLNVEKIMFKMLVKSGNAKTNFQELYLTPQNFYKYKHNLERIFSENSLQIKYLFPKLNYSCELYKNDSITLVPRISTNGNVFVCQRFVNDMYRIGNIKTQSLKGILEGVKLKNIIKLARIAKNYISECDNCNYSPLCEKGCPGEIIESGIVQYNDGYCEVKINEIYS